MYDLKLMYSLKIVYSLKLMYGLLWQFHTFALNWIFSRKIWKLGEHFRKLVKNEDFFQIGKSLSRILDWKNRILMRVKNGEFFH